MSTASFVSSWASLYPASNLHAPAAFGSGALNTLARRPEHADSSASRWQALREDNSSGAPAMSAPEGVVTADTPSVSFLSFPSRWLYRLAFVALGSKSQHAAVSPEGLSTRNPSWSTDS
eukprot:6199461-Pleurochrysis_carterae.AAC.1